MYSTLVAEKSAWRLPERRVAKFVKRQKAGLAGSDDQSVARSVRSAASSWMKKRKNRRASPKRAIKNPEAPPERSLSQNNKTEAAVVTTPTPVVEKKPEEPKEAVPEEKADKPEGTEEKAAEEEKVVEEEKVEPKVEEQETPEAPAHETRGDISLDLTPKTDQGALCEGCLIL